MAERQKMEPDKFAPEGDEDEQEMRIKLLIFRSKNKKLLEMDSFCLSIPIWGVAKQQVFEKKIGNSGRCSINYVRTLGDAQSIMHISVDCFFG